MFLYLDNQGTNQSFIYFLPRETNLIIICISLKRETSHLYTFTKGDKFNQNLYFLKKGDISK